MIAYRTRIRDAAFALGLFLVAAAADARPINVAWDAVADPAVVGYVVYYGTQSGIYTNSVDAGNALIQAFDLPGAQYYFAVRAYDATGNLSPYSLEVSDAAGVVLTNPGDQSGSVGQSISLQLIASGSPVAYSATNLPAGLSIDPNTGWIGGTLSSSAGDASPYLTTAAVSDPGGNISSVQFWWTVKANHPPSVVSPGNQSTLAGTAATLAIVASDPDGDTLTYSASSLPSGLAINSSTGLISGTVSTTAAGSYTVTVTASDGALSGSATFSWVVSVPPPPGSLAVDQTVFVDGSGSSVTTPSFSTVASAETLIAFVTAAQPTLTGAQSATVSGAGLTWTLVARANAQPGTAEVWKATASSVLANVTVTATLSISSTPLTLTVMSFRNAAGVGASAVASATSGAPIVSLTTTAAGSLVYGAGNDWDAAVARTLAANQNMVHQWVVTGSGDTFWVQNVVGTTSAAGVTVNVADLAPTTDRWNYVALEIVPQIVAPSVAAGASTVNLGGTVTFTIANGPGNAADWVGFFCPSSNADSSYADWKYLNNTKTAPAMGLTAGSVTFTAPTTGGQTCNGRLFSNTNTKLATSGTVIVANPFGVPDPPDEGSPSGVTTLTGTNVQVLPVWNVLVTFSNVTSSGMTTVNPIASTRSTSGGRAWNPWEFRVSTTAKISGPITVAIAYDSTALASGRGLFRIFDDAGMALTQRIDTTKGIAYATVSGLPAVLTVERTPNTDFDDDGAVDLVWQNETTRQATTWFMTGAQGNTMRDWGWLISSGISGWRIVGNGDFNGDGHPDLVWQNDSTGQATVWYMAGAQSNVMQSWNWIAPDPVAGWRIVAITDLNGDGHPDLVWQNDSTRQVTAWFLGGNQGNVRQSWSWIESNGIPGWTIVGAGDFDGDGHPDIVWQNDSSRQATIWYMSGTQGTTRASWSFLASGNYPGWAIAGVKDLDKDGHPDLLWQNDSTGQTTVWFGAAGGTWRTWDWIASQNLAGWKLSVR